MSYDIIDSRLVLQSDSKEKKRKMLLVEDKFGDVVRTCVPVPGIGNQSVGSMRSPQEALRACLKGNF